MQDLRSVTLVGPFNRIYSLSRLVKHTPIRFVAAQYVREFPPQEVTCFTALHPGSVIIGE